MLQALDKVQMEMKGKDKQIDDRDSMIIERESWIKSLKNEATLLNERIHAMARREQEHESVQQAQCIYMTQLKQENNQLKYELSEARKEVQILSSQDLPALSLT